MLRQFGLASEGYVLDAVADCIERVVDVMPAPIGDDGQTIGDTA
jgi:hypothetical protein